MLKSLMSFFKIDIHIILAYSLLFNTTICLDVINDNSKIKRLIDKRISMNNLNKDFDYFKHKKALCYLVSSNNSGITSYIEFVQKSKTSPLKFTALVYGAYEIEDISINSKALSDIDFNNSCDNLGLKKFELIFDKDQLKHFTHNNQLEIEGEVLNVSLFDEDTNFNSNTSCLIKYKKSIIQENYEKDVIKNGACGNIQIYDYYYKLIYITALSWFIAISLGALYFYKFNF